LGDFQSGIFECDFITPWSKSGHNLDASVVVIGQDWVSADVLSGYPLGSSVAVFGFDPEFPTNSNLDLLLKVHLQLHRSECYLTNLFVLIKAGNATASIPMADLIWSAHQFTLNELKIVSPRLAICLGLRTFQALLRAAGLEPPTRLEQAIGSPVPIGGSMVHCVAHTGARGTSNRGRRQIDLDWQGLAAGYPEIVTGRRGDAPRVSPR